MLGLDIVKQLDLSSKLTLDSLIVYEQLNSTQTSLAHTASSTGHLWRAIIAQQQTAGEGRQGRIWQSTLGQVALSWRGWVSIPTESIGLISLAVALAIADTLTLFGIKNVQFKWPNDIYIQDKKLAGVLVTICYKKENKFDLVLGIGLNRLHSSLPEQAIALADIIPHPPALSAILAELLMAWHQWKVVLMSEEGRNRVCIAWLERALWVNASVRVLLQTAYIDGVFVGITSNGLLRIATEDGEKIFAAGDVQLRPLE
jgi:BirA family biotin operon repressor/biotin-[acetyl-CoA-carboxylase] ligase